MKQTTINKIIDSYHNGYSRKEIAVKVDLSYSIIVKTLIENKEKVNHTEHKINNYGRKLEEEKRLKQNEETNHKIKIQEDINAIKNDKELPIPVPPHYLASKYEKMKHELAILDYLEIVKEKNYATKAFQEVFDISDYMIAVYLKNTPKQKENLRKKINDFDTLYGYYQEGITIQELSQMYNCTEQTIKNRLSINNPLKYT